MQFLVPNIDLPTSDHDKESEEQIDYRFASLKHKQLHLTEGQLLTIAAAARSPTGIQQLIDSGLPALLTTLITGINSVN
jgi:baculoviral IAP repeat-containing protein 6